jgi:GntR family carbon starvation induced transcriptional regulator
MAGSRTIIPGAREGGSAPTNGASRTIAGDVYDQIRADILACRIEPGAKVKINDFSVQFGVSLGAVREALSKLSSDGLVIAEAQKGFTVAPISHDELIDLTRTRVEIESLCLLDSIKHGDFKWESHVVGALHLLNRLDERDPRDKARLSDAWVGAHSEFHESLVSACRSPIKLRIRKALYEQSERYRRLSVPVRTVERNVPAEHQAIVTAAIARDARRATTLMADHITRTTDILLGASFLDSRPAKAKRSGAKKSGSGKPRSKKTKARS